MLLLLELREYIKQQARPLSKKPPLITTAIIMALLPLLTYDDGSAIEEIAGVLAAIILIIITLILFFIINSRLKTYPKESRLPSLGSTFKWYAIVLIVIGLVYTIESIIADIFASVIALVIDMFFLINILNIFLPDEEEKEIDSENKILE